jgi:hypothetical protein
MTRHRLRVLSALVVAAAAVIALATCGREPAAPRGPAALAVAAVLPAGLDLAAFNLSIDSIRLIARNSQAVTVFDKTYGFPANQSSVAVQADVPLAQSPETFDVTIELRSGTVVLFSGTKTFSLTSGSNATPPPIPVSYTGPGNNVATLTLGPLDSLLTEGSSLQFRVSAKDGVGANVPSFYVAWRTSDPANVPIDASGTLKAPLVRRTVTVQARAFPDTTVQAATSVQFIPLPNTMSFDSGCAQSALPGVQLPQPIVARVLGKDGLGVPAVQVAFSAVTAGGVVATPTATTDTGGRARTLVTLPTTAGPATFQASVTGLAAATCNQTVLASPPTQLAFKTQPANAVAGVALTSIQVEVRDASGTLVTSATNAVTIAIGTNPGGATLTGTKTVNAIAGVATFTNLSLDKVGIGYTLAAASSGLSSATSNTFSITAGVLAQLKFTTQPVNITAGAIETVVVAGQDLQGNTVLAFTGPVSLAFGSHPSGSTLTGTVSVSAVAGVATFAALGRLTVAGGYTLVASASGVGSVVSSSFTVNPAPATVLAFVVQPTSGFAGAIISPIVVVAVEDSLGNVVTSATNPVTISFGANPGQSTLGGMLTRNAASGLANFTDLTVSTAASGYTLVASASGGIQSATSATFDEIVQPPGVVWKAPVNGNWSNPANWSPSRVPGPADTVSIIVPGTYSVTLDVNGTVAFLTVGNSVGGTVLTFAPGHNLTIDSVAVVQVGGALDLTANDTISGPGSLIDNGSILLTSSALTLAGVSNASLVQAAGTSAITGSFSNSSGGGLLVEGSPAGDGILTIASGFLNAGGIVLTDGDAAQARNATLVVTSGVLTNTVGGSLQSVPGSVAGGSRTLRAMLDNQGTVAVQQTLTIDQAAATHGNSGQILLLGGDLNVILSGFRPAFSNESGGLIDVGTNKLVITNQSSGSFVNQPGGTLQGSGTIDIGTASFIDDGLLDVGGSPGILQFVGPYTEGPSPAAMSVEIGGDPATPGVTFDQFQVSDNVNLQGGILNATQLGANPPSGDYVILVVPAGKTITGDFQTKNLPTNPLAGPCTGGVSGTQYVIHCP